VPARDDRGGVGELAERRRPLLRRIVGNRPIRIVARVRRVGTEHRPLGVGVRFGAVVAIRNELVAATESDPATHGKKATASRGVDPRDELSYHDK
jgi:hypothetical protein